MRVHRLLGFLAGFAMLHLVVAGGGFACHQEPISRAQTPSAAASPAPEDCMGHAAMPVTHEHTPRHGTAPARDCCQTLHLCASVLASATSRIDPMTPATTTAVPRVPAEDIPAPLFPPDPPPPKV